MTRGLVAALLTASLLTACDREPHTDPGAVLICDSAGVTIVTVSPAAVENGSLLSIDSLPLMYIGAGSGAQVELGRPTSALLLHDGGLAVLDWGAMTIWRFGPDGAALPQVGRRGHGPGEFDSPRFLRRWSGDTLAIWDPGNGRVHLYDADARWLTDRDLAWLGSANLNQPLAGDTMLVTRSLPPDIPPADGIMRAPIAVFRATPEGETQVFELQGPPYFVEVAEDGTMAVLDVPFGPWPDLLPADVGMLYAPSESPFLEVRDPSGRLMTRIELPDRRREVTSSEWEAVVRERIALEHPVAREKAAEMFEAMPRPRRHPAYTKVLTGRDGSTWIQAPADPSRQVAEWTVVLPGWASVARIAVPTDWNLYDVGLEGIVVGLSENDVPVVAVYGVRLSGEAED